MHTKPLPCRIRTLTDDGTVRVFNGRLPAWRHRSIQLGLLHEESNGFIELTPGTRSLDGRLDVDRRKKPEHFLPVGQADWLRRALYHAERIIEGAYAGRRFFPDGPREEVFVGVAPREAKAGGREHVQRTRWLWVDVDEVDRLPDLYTFLAERPCHLLVESAGTGGVHSYWKLNEVLAATRVDKETGELHESIERANLRLIHRLGADKQCSDRSRILRLAGSRNWKSGGWARIIQADLVLPPYTLSELVGDLPDPDSPRPGQPDRIARTIADDPYRAIPAVEYMARLANLETNLAGFVSCPSPAHEDAHPSCRVGGPDPTLWKCFACGVGGTLYDAASLVLGGPVGPDLRGEAFRKAKQLVLDTFGDLEREEPGQ